MKAPRPAWPADWLPWVAGASTLFVLFAFLLYPILKTLLLSFIPAGESLAIANLTLAGFQDLFDSPTFRDALGHTITVALATTFISTLLALPAAYALARVRMANRNLILALSVIPVIAPPFIGAYSWIILLGRNGIVTRCLESWFGLELPSIYGPTGIILALSLHYFPYVFLFVQGALMAADPALEESAYLMGASRWHVLRTITFPLVLPTILSGALIVLVKALGNFGVPAILGGDYYVLPTLIYYQIHGMFDINAGSAIALVNVLITLIAIVIVARIMRKRRYISVTGTTRRLPPHTGSGVRMLAHIYLWGLLALALLPQLVVVFTSFAERWGASLLPTAYGISNYVRMFDGLIQPIQNSLILSAGATLLCVLFGTLAAYAAVQRRFAGRWALDLTIMLPFVLPGIVTGVAFLTTFNSGPLVLTGTATILILAYFVRRIAYIFRSVSAAFGQLDPSIEEASTMCGSPWTRTMRKVTIPLVAPGILAGGILVFSTLITEMSVTIIIYSAQWKTISIAIFEQLVDDEVFTASAIGSVAIGLTLVLVFVASRLVGKTMAEMFR